MAEQKMESVVMNIDANTKQTIDIKLAEGFVIHSVTNLNPTFDKLLIIYNKNLPPEP